MANKCNRGLDDRCRDSGGEIRRVCTPEIHVQIVLHCGLRISNHILPIINNRTGAIAPNLQQIGILG
jgi:hypothetical protein